jgi:hypothetical protein
VGEDVDYDGDDDDDDDDVEDDDEWARYDGDAGAQATGGFHLHSRQTQTTPVSWAGRA